MTPCSGRVVAIAAGRTDSLAATTGALSVYIPAGAPAQAQLRAFRADWAPMAFPNVSKAAALADVVAISATHRGSTSR